MAKRIWKNAAIAIFVIIVAAITALGVVSGQDVKAVKGFEMTKNTSSTISMQWKKTKKADGYYLYKLDEQSNKYVQLAKNKGASNCKYEMTKLGGASIEKIKVLAYREFMGREYLSASAQEHTVYTNPSQPDLSAFSGGKGVLSAEWEDADNLSGYELQYSKSEDFADYKSENINDGEARNFSVRELTPGDVYYVRMRSYMTMGKKTVYSKWSATQQTTIYDRDLNIEQIDPSKPMVAFSFDDGPAYDYKGSNSTERILAVLEKYGARATFFMVGERVNSETKHLLEKEIQLGCELGNHTYAHNHYGSEVTAGDISKASKQIKKISGKSPTIFRCPGGNVTSTIRKECKKEGMPLAYWSVDTQDWHSKNADKIYKNITKYVYDGSIVLMHDIYPSTAKAVEKVVPELIEKGYQIVTVSELISAKTGEKPKAGAQYVDYKTINNNTH